MPRLLLTRVFDRWRRKARIADETLRAAVDEIQAGLVDADLGGGLYKKRIPLPGRGKRGGARTLLATNLAGRWIFLRGFAKNERADITPDETAALRELAKDLLAAAETRLKEFLSAGVLKELENDSEP